MIYYYWRYCNCAIAPISGCAKCSEKLSLLDPKIPYDPTFAAPWTKNAATIPDDFMARTLPQTRVVYNAESGEIYTEFLPRQG